MIDGSEIDGGGIENEGYSLHRLRLSETGWNIFIAPSIDDSTG
jgi:hypothetical protein